jgi:hypothetical protein
LGKTNNSIISFFVQKLVFARPFFKIDFWRFGQIAVAAGKDYFPFRRLASLRPASLAEIKNNQSRSGQKR